MGENLVSSTWPCKGNLTVFEAHNHDDFHSSIRPKTITWHWKNVNSLNSRIFWFDKNACGQWTRNCDRKSIWSGLNHFNDYSSFLRIKDFFKKCMGFDKVDEVVLISTYRRQSTRYSYNSRKPKIFHLAKIPYIDRNFNYYCQLCRKSRFYDF